MNQKDLIPEGNAASLSGVASSTLNRFAEAGYLHISTGSDGLRYFSRDELHQVFNIPLAKVSATQEVSSLIEKIEVETLQASPLSKDEEEREAQIEDDATMEGGPPVPKSSEAEQPATGTNSENDVHPLSRVVELQDKILDLKDQRIRELELERDWLKAMVEKFQSQQTRDQMLLLSETQNIRQLILLQERRKSPLRMALEYLGLTEKETPPSNKTLIEISK